MSRSRFSSGLTRAGEFEWIGGPHKIALSPGAIRGVVFCHAYSHRAVTMLNFAGRPEAWNLVKALSEKFPTIVADQALDNWGNDAGITAVTACVNTLQAATSPAQAKSDKVLLVGVSMGFTLACAWARANLTKVAAIAGIIPNTDLGGLYTRDYNGSKAAIDGAYDGAWIQATHGPTHDPLVFGAQLNFPIRLYYGADDPAAIPSSMISFAAVAPNCVPVNLGNIGGHDTEAAYQPALNAGLIDFLTGASV